MEDTREAHPGSHWPLVYQIRVEAHLGAQWADWFEGMTITAEANGETLLTGPVVDQAMLHSLLRKVRDLGLSLVSVMRVGPARTDRATPQAGAAGKGNRS